jgi:hypothetical protein
MSKIRGHGGFWVLPGPAIGFTGPPLPGTIQHNAIYTVVTAVETRPSRTGNSGGWGETLPVIRRVESASFRVAEDDVSYPEAIGFTEGAELTVYLKIGELGQYDRIVRTIVESVHKENDQRRARWVEVVCQGGIYQRRVAPPVLPPGA